ncbi:MAG: DUF554 domain-containing protein [Clostridium sp.]|uniref:DUF554 domain-containing protein n=1 Tax=Clostridium sp. TaxID=1506 RepID=UPI0030459E93
MLGTMVNSLAIILGCVLGLLIKGGISEKISNTIMKGLALCVLYIGINGSLEGQNTLITIVCMALGGLIGEFFDLDKQLNNLGKFIENKVNKKFIKSKNSETSQDISNKPIKAVSISQGFIYSSLIFCVGAMAVVGSLESGLQGNHSTLFAKSIIDGIAAIIFTASLGIGVIFSAVSVFIYQGVITISAVVLSNILSATVISSMTSIGSLLIIGLALNMLDATKIKVANLLPAVFLPIIFGIVGIL